MTTYAHCYYRYYHGLIVFLDIYAFTAKFVYVYVAHYFILLRLNPFDLSVDRQG